MSRVFSSAALLAVLAAGGIIGACGSSDPAPAGRGSCADVQLVVAASDHLSSTVCGAPNCESGPTTTGVDLGVDPILSMSGGRTFLMARELDTIFELDPKCGFAVHPEDKSIHMLSDGSRPANPHDLAVAPDGSLFVVLFNVPTIAIVKDGKVDGTIDISKYDGDGEPDADAIRILPVGGVAKAFVTLERLTRVGNNLLSQQPSTMLRIDVASRIVEASIPLEGRNPFNAMAEQNGVLFLAEAGDFDSSTDALAGIERFDTATSTTRLFVHEQDLGGSVSEVAVTDGCGVAIVAGAAHTINPTSLVTFDPATGKVLSTAAAPVYGPTAGYDLQGLAWRGASLYVGDRRRGGTGYPVHVFDREPGTCILQEMPSKTIQLPQPPVSLRPAL